MPPLIEAPSDELCEAVLALCDAIASGARWHMPGLARDFDAQRLREILEWHGLTPALPKQGREASERTIPVDLRAEWPRHRHRRQMAANLLVLGQLEEIAGAFAERRIGLIALKGAAALLELYGDRRCRRMADLDLLVEAQAIPEVRRVMEGLGYTALPNRSSEQEEELLLKRSHLRPYVKRGRLPVEIHVDILQGRGRSDEAIPELWRQAVDVTCGNARLRSLSPIHFMLHTAAHYMKDLERGFGSLNGIVDLLLVLKKRGSEIDWQEFWETTNRWGIERDAATLISTLNRHWGLSVAHVPSGATSLPAATLVYGLPNAGNLAAIRQAENYKELLALARELPDVSSRLRYLFRLLFPTPDKLRYRYRVPAGKGIALYYAWHPIDIVGHSLKGLSAAARSSLARTLGERS